MTVQELLEANGIKPDSYEPGQHSSICPQCSHKRVKKNLKCLGVLIDPDGKSACWNCGHCGWSGPKKGSGGKPREGEITHDYRDADGALQFQKVRNPPGSTARFYCRRPDGNGRWINSLKRIDHKPLYRWPEILKAMEQGREIAIVEGEKDADNLWALGIPATCNFDGAADVLKNPKVKPKWKIEYSEQLRGARLIVFNDNDPQGYAHADHICRASIVLAARVRRLDLAPHWPDIPKGGDVSDWLALGHTGEELAALIENTPDYAAPEQGREQQEPKEETTNGTDAEIVRLAKLSTVEYEQQRKGAAEKLDMRTAILDKLVEAERLKLNPASDGKQGRAVTFPEPEPWPEPLSGPALLNGITGAIRRHIVMPRHAVHAAALWTLHTFLVSKFFISPRLGIRSPTKGCGKTLFLDVLARLVLRPLPTANVTPPAIFRAIEAHQPCLLIDEADTFLYESDELRGVLNSGYRKGGSVLRTVGEDFEPRAFATYSACAIAIIGALPDTLHDRAVTIDLQRRRPQQRIEPYRPDRANYLDVLARKAMRWTTDHADRIGERDPDMPDGIINREADNWRPLLAIADEAGGRWVKRARAAATRGHSADMDEGSLFELLLADIRDVFGKRMQMPSADLVAALVAIEGRPWADGLGKNRDKPLTANRLAGMLKRFKIASGTIRVGDKTPKGYVAAHFAEAFTSYLPNVGDSETPQRHKADETGTSDLCQSATPKSDVADRKCEKPANDAHCGVVADEKRDPGRASAKQSLTNGSAAGLSQRTIADLANDYTERAYANAQKSGGDTRTAELDADLRRRLAEMVLPEFVETEFGRVLTVVFRV